MDHRLKLALVNKYWGNNYLFLVGISEVEGTRRVTPEYVFFRALSPVQFI